MECYCSDEWVLSYDVQKDFIDGKTLSHSDECEKYFLEDISNRRNLQILNRWKWATATNKSCDSPYSHSPHGTCSGRAFDRT